MIVKLFQFTLISLLLVSFTHAETSAQRSGQLQKDISSARKNLKNSQAKSNQLKQKVQLAEDKLSEISQQLHSTEVKINHLTTKLTKSNTQKKKLTIKTEQQKSALAQQMQALYTSGKQSHLRLLLKQDDPSDISRTIKYFEYMNKHRLKKITLINKRLQKIKKVQTEINEDTSALKRLQKKQKTKKQSLKSAVITKEKSLKKQYTVVISKKKKLQRLQREETKLNQVIQRLENKRKKEEVAQKAKVKKEALKKERAIEVASAKKINKTVKKRVQKMTTIKRHYVPNKPFSTLKGKLSWPVRGRILHKYGSTRNSKQNWHATVIAAPGGTNVHAVARGKVEFSGRLNGYGYLIIIRHDNNYRSLYGYNRSVFKKEGQIVKAGEVIASVGNSGRIKQTGLYFEIAKKTARRNPAIWCR